jgi:hypothetical protein
MVFKKSGNSESQTSDRYYATTVSNVPADIEDLDALTGSWQRRKAPPKTGEELNRDRRIEWAHEQASKIRLAARTGARDSIQARAVKGIRGIASWPNAECTSV